MAGGGGSWKVAYADFTTAMMAFFMWSGCSIFRIPKQLENFQLVPTLIG